MAAMLTRLLFGLAAGATLSAMAAFAGPASPRDVISADILPGWRQADGTHVAALRLRLADKWKTYWRAPGEAGIPPVFDWAGSANVADVTFHWPTPRVFELNGMRTVGYAHELVLPMEVRAVDSAEPIALAGHVMLGVCRDICMPVELEFTAELAPGGRPDPAISAALAAGPQSARSAGVRNLRCHIEPISDGLRVTASLDAPVLGGREMAIFETPDPNVWISEATSERSSSGMSVTADFVPPRGQPLALDRSRLRLTLIGDSGGIDMQGCPAG